MEVDCPLYRMKFFFAPDKLMIIEQTREIVLTQFFRVFFRLDWGDSVYFVCPSSLLRKGMIYWLLVTERRRYKTISTSKIFCQILLPIKRLSPPRSWQNIQGCLSLPGLLMMKTGCGWLLNCLNWQWLNWSSGWIFCNGGHDVSLAWKKSWKTTRSVTKSCT